MPRVIGFLRVSTEEQADKDRTGLLRQREDIRVAAARYGLEIIEVVELIGVSGTSTYEAPEFNSMISAMERPEIHGVVVSSQDRLARPDTLGGLAIFDCFAKFRKKIWTPTQ